MDEFQEMAGKIMNTDSSKGGIIAELVEKYLGKGKKVSDTTPAQAEFVNLIVSEIKETLSDILG